MENKYKCELVRESLEIRIDFEDFPRSDRDRDTCAETESDVESGSEFLPPNMVVLRKKCCYEIGCIEYQINLELMYSYGSEDLKIQFDIKPEGHVANFRIKELYLKVVGMPEDLLMYDYDHEGRTEWREKIGTLHSRDLPNKRTDFDGNIWQCLFRGADSHNLEGFDWEMATITGWFVCTFETTRSLQVFRGIKTTTMKYFSTLKPPTNDFDFEIIVEEAEGSDETKPVKFHKSFLGQVSDVFHRMFQHPEMLENQTGRMKCKGFHRKTIKKFHDLLYKQNLTKQDITIDLMKFADKYMVNDLYSFCSDHFKNHVSKANLIELIKIASLKNDDALLDGCAEFIRKVHDRRFFKSEDWKSFAVENLECMGKVMSAM